MRTAHGKAEMKGRKTNIEKNLSLRGSFVR